MNDLTIQCPHCHGVIPLTESLARPLIEREREQIERRTREKEEELARREQTAATLKLQLEQERRRIDEVIAERLGRERQSVVEAEAKKARELVRQDFEAKQRELSEVKAAYEARGKKLEEAQRAQAEVERKKRELDDAKRALELTIEQRVNDHLVSERNKARKAAEEQAKQELIQRDQQIDELKKQIDVLRNKAEEGSQRLHGEAQERSLEESLQERFPEDRIEPVAKGQRGADVIQRVMTPQGKLAGTVVWESKRTKRFSPGWLAKLRADQRNLKADVSVLVSQALPEEADPFGCVDGVWVVPLSLAVPVAVVLRQGLIEVAEARQAAKGRESKMALIYEYLTGSQFRQRVEAMVEAYRDMRDTLEQERRALMKSWAKREKQLDQVLRGMTGMYGDLQGIAGRSLQEIEGLDLKALAAAGGETDEEE